MKRTLIVTLLFLFVITACSGRPAATQDPNALATLVQQGIEQTLAAASPTPEPTFTPTATSVPLKKIALIDSDIQLNTINSDGTGLTRVSSNANVEGTYDYYSNGEWIAYETYIESDGSSEIYIMRSDGSEVRKLVAHNKNNYNPAWSPDGGKILFMADMTSDRHDRDIFVVNADGTGLFNLSNSSNFDVEPVWSPDGTRIAYRSGRFLSDEELASFSGGSSDTHIVVKDVVTGAKVVLPLAENLESPSNPKWSPDGTQIIFNCGGTSTKQDETIYLQGICKAAADGSNVEVLYSVETQLITGPIYHPDAVWSPDGSQIAFVGLLEDGVTSEIFTMNSDGSNIQQLTSSDTVLKTEPVWSKDGSMLLFVGQEGSVLRRTFTVYVLNSDGSGMVQIFERYKYPPMAKWLE